MVSQVQALVTASKGDSERKTLHPLEFCYQVFGLYPRGFLCLLVG